MARKTGRDIVMVDLSQARSKWYGESEKRVKAIFTDYREKCNESKVIPILLINEADGLLSQPPKSTTGPAMWKACRARH
ncbi:MAG: AAA family ATPase [Gammaproteobacteria bacterium]